MPNKTLRFMDLYVPNFDDMLLKKLNYMTPEQRETIPPELKFKIFKKKDASIEAMNFIEKMFLLSVCFRQVIVVATLDEEAGIGIKDFNKVLAAQRGKLKNIDLLQDMQLQSIFVQGDKELMRCWQYMNHIQCSEIYDLIKGSEPTKASRAQGKQLKFQRNFAGLIRTIVNYESRKKDVIINFGISVPKLYALLYFYDGEKKGSDFYNIAFKHAYSSNRADLSVALAELWKGGYLHRRGVRSNMRYSITATGINLLTRVINKLVYNY